MDKQQLLYQIKINHEIFSDYILSLSEEEYNFAPEGKWSAGQQLDHIIRSVRPLAKALILPEFIFKILFGKTNRASKNYESLILKYKAKLASGGSASGPFIPSVQLYQFRNKQLFKLNILKKKLLKRSSSFSETQMDRIVLPHPLLGKVSLREMLYFTAYHVLHHHDLTKQYLTGK